MSTAHFAPSGPLQGELTVPADKSISHRAAILAAMADGETVVRNYLDSADTRSTLDAMRRLGAEVAHGDPARGGELKIQGVGLHGPRPTDGPIDVGNAGTLLRLLPGWLAGQGQGAWTLDGDESIRRRPVDRIAEPLRRMGATIECRDNRHPPLEVHGTALHGIEYELPVASAQVKSCLLLAALLAASQTTIVESIPSRDHTERMLKAAGAEIEVAELNGGRTITVKPAQSLDPGQIEVPADFSSAAFFIAAALLIPGSEITLTGVGVNPTRTGLLRILARMGADIELANQGEKGGEPVADLFARHSSLSATTITPNEVPATIDELPLVALLACFAEGETTLTGAGELRHKESDRITALVTGLTALGAQAEPHPDGFTIQGTGNLPGGDLDAHNDHRLAMLGAIAGHASQNGVTVHGIEAAAVSYPRFEADLASLLH